MTKKNMTIDDLAALMQRTMASKEDIAQLRLDTKEDIAQLRLDTKEDIAQLRLDTKEDLKRLEQKVDAGFYAVNSRIDSLRNDISDLPDMREELTDLGMRMDRVERKVGLTR